MIFALRISIFLILTTLFMPSTSMESLIEENQTEVAIFGILFKDNKKSLTDFQESVATMLKKNDLSSLDAQSSPLLNQYLYTHNSQLLPELLFIKKINVQVNDKPFGSSPLNWAIQNGSAEDVRLLLLAGAKTNTTLSIDGLSHTPLTQAITKSDFEKTSILLRFGADPNIRLPDHIVSSNALLCAIRISDPAIRLSMISLLLENGAHSHTHTMKHFTIFMHLYGISVNSSEVEHHFELKKLSNFIRRWNLLSKGTLFGGRIRLPATIVTKIMHYFYHNQRYDASKLECVICAQEKSIHSITDINCINKHPDKVCITCLSTIHCQKSPICPFCRGKLT